MSNLMKGYPVGADLLQVDGQTHGRTDREKEKKINKKNYSNFSQFWKAPKITTSVIG